MFLVPEDILENVICDGCKKYLSVSPVKVYPNKQILCGRCSRGSEGGVVSLYNNVVQHGLFRCINRYDGCNQVLIYSEVVNHEANCKSKLYNCPNCLSIPKMSSFLLINHFKECHKSNILKKSNFVINVNMFNVDDGKYLYIKDNFLFVICANLNNGEILLNTFHIGDEVLSKEIKQSFILSSSDGMLKRYTTAKQPCSKYEGKYFNGGFTICVTLKGCDLNVDFDLDTQRVQTLLLLPIHCNAYSPVEQEDSNILIDEHKIYISEKFKKKWFPPYSLHNSEHFVIKGKNRILKRCSICLNKFHYFSFNQSVYKCTECNLGCGTFICSKCYFFGIKRCCEKNFEFAPEETAVAKDLQYFCRWNCGIPRFSWELKDHEYNCKYQMSRICPLENCRWTGQLFKLRDHVRSHNSTVLYEEHSFPLNLLKTPNFIFKSELIIPVLNYFVSVKWKKAINNYIFSLNIKDNSDKYPMAIISNNGKIDIFDNFFVLVFDVESAPSLLVTLR